MKYPQCQRCTKAVVPILFLGNLGLAVLKIVVGILGNSAGLIADGAHSSTDAISTVMLYVGLWFSNRPADESHPYGHRNMEFILAKVVGILLLLLGISILFSSVYKLMQGNIQTPDFVTFAVAAIGILVNVVCNRYGTCVGTQMNSPAVLSVAFEIKADAMSSVAIAIGIFVAEMGYPMFDPIAACVVAVLIMKHSIHIIKDAMDGLMDSSIDPALKRKITNLVKRHSEVLGIDFIRARRLGRDMAIEAGIRIPASKTVDEGNLVAREIRSDLVNLVENLSDVEISITSAKPEDYK